MINIVLVDKGGTIKTVKIKDNSRNNLYKKCGIRSDKDFKCHTKWNVTLSGEKHRIELWGRTEGKANTENKYDFPPPMDNSLFFGSCCLVKVDINTNLLVNLTQELWEKIYEKLLHRMIGRERVLGLCMRISPEQLLYSNRLYYLLYNFCI